ncbi:LysE family translocator [SCandidatus Aminicenantes bacterium Aminicenantia_JdfR_composite]|jgi:threonine/homoserine/homoserine lactone efflux protein|nr:LysE family translocator [SCandidatus Aminicenantes bacterium Aminicenantia_JdfR_composite]MCP2620766.1 LysE family translocator [Candidatus Aminicenantes bacterium AC-334-E05]
MIGAIPFLFSSIVFGLAAGISPGPLLTLVISETLKYNKKEGFKVAIAPLVTDVPIVLITIFILTKLSNFNSILGVISILGAIFLTYLAYESITFKGINLDLQKLKPQSLKKGVIANFLNPHPYIFWFTIGAPTILKASRVNMLSVVFFYCWIIWKSYRLKDNHSFDSRKIKGFSKK